MPTATLKCCNCKQRFPREQVEKHTHNNLRFCSTECVTEYALNKGRKAREKALAKKDREHKREIKKKEKADRAEHRKRKQALKPISWFHNKARVACNAYVRYRDRNEICISCDKPLAFEEKYDAGHWKTQGAHKWIAYDEMNVNGQCVRCNQHMSGNEAAQRPRLVAKWGLANVERLEQSGKNLGEKSYTRDELLEIEKYYKEKLSALQAKD